MHNGKLVMSKPAPTPTYDFSNAVLLHENRDGIANLTLNRPEARNALSEEMISAITDELDVIAKDRSIRVVILRGNGSAFCAGHDLKQMTMHRSEPDHGRAYFLRLFERCAKIMQRIVSLPQPVIGCVHGVATAAGCQMVASCDLVVASEAACFATPGIQIGLFCSSPMVALTRKISNAHAMEMLLTGEMISAKRAYEIGLVNRVVPIGHEYDETLNLARAIASKSSYVQKIGKEAFYRQRDMNLTDAYEYSARVMAENMMAHDAEEGISAFIEKRDPKWEDR
jgi:enoyl-CoA hydratase/carnithine racemase